MSFITGVGLTSFGRHEGSSTLDLMGTAAELAIADAGLKRAEIDGVLCGYSTVQPHIMLATVFAEHFGITPSYAHAVQVGGATGLAMTMLAHTIVEAGLARHVLVVSGENRLTGQSRDAAIQALAQVGHPEYEMPLGPTIPAYYGLVASRYMYEYGVTQEDLAEFAVLMRDHAADHPGAQFRDRITVADVMNSKPVALPLKLLDCCPVSDGGAAFVVSREATSRIGVRVRGCAQAHTHQYVTTLPQFDAMGAAMSLKRASAASGIAIGDVRYAGIYDSFTITLAMLLEELGLAGRGEAAARVRGGHFSRNGAIPLNTHGGLLSYGHCGVGGAMAHLVETQLQMTGRAGNRQVRDASIALLHGDGGVLSSHVSMFLERVR
jgi:acetyl-CoA acetyltransferase